MIEYVLLTIVTDGIYNWDNIYLSCCFENDPVAFWAKHLIFKNHSIPLNTAFSSNSSRNKYCNLIQYWFHTIDYIPCINILLTSKNIILSSHSLIKSERRHKSQREHLIGHIYIEQAYKHEKLIKQHCRIAMKTTQSI